MRSSIRPFRRFSEQCSAAYHAGTRLKLTLAYCSVFWLLSVFLEMNTESVYAEWVSVSVVDQAGVTIYFEPVTIHRKGNRVKMLELIDYRTIQTVAGTTFLSARVQREYDCDGDRHRTLSMTKLSGNMATGKVILTTSEVQTWEPADPGSIGKRLWRIACDKK